MPTMDSAAHDRPLQRRLRRDPNLDLIRALAVLTVVTVHAAHIFGRPQLAPMKLGFAAIDAFFCLSGFLVGQILLREPVNPSAYGRFLKARWARSLPPYYIVLLGGLAAGSLIGWPWTLDDFEGRFWRYLFFIQNGGDVTRRPLSVSWSLCIEEQFYLTLPIAFLVIRTARSRALLMVALILLVNIWRFSSPHGWYFTAAVRGDAICYGVLLALLKTEFPETFQRWRKTIGRLLPVVLVLIVLLATAPIPTLVFSSLFNPLLALFMAAFEGRESVPRAALSIVSWLARISYSTYLFHLDFVILPLAEYSPLVQLVLFLPASLLLGTIGQRLLEEPSYRLRDRWLGSERAPSR